MSTFDDARRKEAVAKHFDDHATDWKDFYDDREHGRYLEFKARMEAVLGELERLSPPDDARRVLDVGCGSGPYLGRLSALPGGGVGIDVAPGMVGLARQRLDGKRGWGVLLGSAVEVPLGSAGFDAVLAAGLIEYFNRPEEVLSEFARVLKPGGIGIVTFPHRYSWSRLGGLPRSLMLFLRISTKLRLAEILYKLRGKKFDPSNHYLGECYGRGRVRRIARLAGLEVERISTSGFFNWPILGIQTLPRRWRVPLGLWVQERRGRLPWRLLGSDLIAVFRKGPGPDQARLR